MLLLNGNYCCDFLSLVEGCAHWFHSLVDVGFHKVYLRCNLLCLCLFFFKDAVLFLLVVWSGMNLLSSLEGRFFCLVLGPHSTVLSTYSWEGSGDRMGFWRLNSAQLQSWHVPSSLYHLSGPRRSFVILLDGGLFILWCMHLLFVVIFILGQPGWTQRLLLAWFSGGLLLTFDYALWAL